MIKGKGTRPMVKNANRVLPGLGQNLSGSSHDCSRLHGAAAQQCMAGCAAFSQPYCANSPRASHGGEEDQSRDHMLQVIGAGVETNLEAGGQVPTNWASLSNTVRCDLISEICKLYNLPAMAKSYTLLHPSIPFNDPSRTGALFLVRSEPCRLCGSGSGRWALVAGTRL
jgi:hypothetical protein